MTGTAIALPTDASAAMQLARELAKARLVPQAFQQSPADIFMVMATTSRLGLDFFLTIGECYVVKGRLMFSGKLSSAIINSSGYLAERLAFEYSGEGPTRKVVVSARLQNETAPRTVEVELAKVKTENAVWTTQPDQQLSYAGARIWGRRHVPEVLLGMLFEGETIDVTPTSVVTREAPAPTFADSSSTPHPSMPQDQRSTIIEQKVEDNKVQAETVTEEAVPFTLAREDGGDWRAWATLLLAYIKSAPDADTINEWCLRNDVQLSLLKQQEPANYTRLVDLIKNQLTLRQEQANG
jgi:hypothetical protein